MLYRRHVRQCVSHAGSGRYLTFKVRFPQRVLSIRGESLRMSEHRNYSSVCRAFNFPFFFLLFLFLFFLSLVWFLWNPRFLFASWVTQRSHEVKQRRVSKRNLQTTREPLSVSGYQYSFLLFFSHWNPLKMKGYPRFSYFFVDNFDFNKVRKTFELE